MPPSALVTRIIELLTFYLLAILFFFFFKTIDRMAWPSSSTVFLKNKLFIVSKSYILYSSSLFICDCWSRMYTRHSN